MVEIRWIKMTLFVILLLLQFTASGQTLSSVTTRAGDEVTLSCNNVIKNQDKCNSTTWIHSRSGVTEELVILGKVKDNVISKAKSSRLSLTSNCSLVIRNVTTEDVGRYTCRQFISDKQQGPDAPVVLSVINMEGTITTDTVSLFCSVLIYDQCEHTVEWLYEGDKSDVETSQRNCSATVTLSAPPLYQKSKYYELLKCKVTDKKSGETLLSKVGPQFSCEKTGSTSVGRNNTSSAKNDTPTKQGWWRFIILGLATLMLIVLAVYMWKRTKGNRTQMDDNAVHHEDEDEDEGTVTYENVGEPSASVRLH
ncbi:uncharacterized protein LOC129106766 isoform X2 [Anoplopoma fimbria]|uniref:uncharacterized protein LOC129106766 isoform X2 n=1 Tax=Anoplopoma fimbria TaxID=229290 RepID=UPI0023ECDB18|nr:uncharacterized protein LOC129106766 isoform X2 [Anoplopoma fimbria]